jgi:hypothetical protein
MTALREKAMQSADEMHGCKLLVLVLLMAR